MELTLPTEWIARLPTDRPVTADDVLQLPEGPPHVELIAGEVVVSPSPIPIHSRAAGHLFRALDRACPRHLELFCQPLDWMIDDLNLLAPDLLVTPRTHVGPKRLDGPPTLVVEILSPSTRARDLAIKREAYARGDAHHYWVVDPAVPRLHVLRRTRVGTYETVVDLSGSGTFQTDDPYPIGIDVADLVR